MLCVYGTTTTTTIRAKVIANPLERTCYMQNGGGDDVELYRHISTICMFLLCIHRLRVSLYRVVDV